MNWFLMEGLQRYGYDDLAQVIRQDTLGLIEAAGFREYYDARDGSGCGSSDFSWSAALALELSQAPNNGETCMVHHIVAGLIIKSDRILLGHRSERRAFYPNVWDVFGGHMEPGEQPEETLVREIREELGITPTQWTNLETITESVPAHDGVPAADLICHLYCVTAWSGTPVNQQPHEHSTIQWFSYAEAIQLNLADPVYPRLFAQCLHSLSDHER